MDRERAVEPIASSAGALRTQGTGRPRRRWRRFGAILFAILLVAYGGLSWSAGSAFLHPLRRLPPLPGADDDAGRWSLVETRTADGIRLAGSVVEPAAEVRGTVLLFHGLSSHRPVRAMRVLAGRGFRAVAFDFRGHGFSGGETTSFGYRERLDVEAVIAFAREEWPGAPLGAIGSSLGGAALCYAAETAATLDAVVLESVYSTIDRAYANRLDHYAPAGLGWLGLGPRLCAEWQLGIEPEELRPVEWAKRLDPRRTLVTCGAADPLTRPDELAMFAEALPGARIVLVPEAGHSNVWTTGGDAYIQQLESFLLERFGRR